VRLTRLVEAAAVLLGLAFLGAQFPGPFALLDNLSNFPAHFGAAFLACAALLAWRGRRGRRRRACTRPGPALVSRSRR
jgi:hypothetical protein